MSESAVARAVPTTRLGERGPAPEARSARLLVAGLVTLGLLPLLANTLRRVAIAVDAGGAAEAETAAPLSIPVLLHILGATVFVILGAFQFSARLRRRSWHRSAGRLLMGVGLLTAFSGLWLAAFASLPANSGELLYIVRLLAGIGMALSLALGFAAIRRRDIAAHRAWMIRAVAIGLGAGTQVFTLGFGQAIFGETELSVAVLNGAGWAVNLAIAELVIRRRTTPRGRPVASAPALP